MRALARIRRLARPVSALEATGWLLAAAAWLVLGAGTLTGWSSLVHHHALLGGHGAPGPAALAGFFVSWQLMIVAMMLPTAMPLVALFARASRGSGEGPIPLGIVVAAYFVVWTGFAALALAGDALLHALLHRLPTLAARDGLITGALVSGAGAFQFSDLKRRCLDACRNPLHFLWRYYRRGPLGALELGVRHAAFCVGCCWALMLVMFGVGVGSLGWMLGLTGVMVLEKTTAAGRRVVPYVGAAMLLYGGAMIAIEVARW